MQRMKDNEHDIPVRPMSISVDSVKRADMWEIGLCGGSRGERGGFSAKSSSSGWASLF